MVESGNRKGRTFSFKAAEVKALSDHEPKNGNDALMRISCKLML